jgi:hypothetical protein
MPKPKLLVHPMPVARPLLMILVATIRDPGVRSRHCRPEPRTSLREPVVRRSDTERVR